MVLLYINNHQHSGHRWAIILASAKPETLQAPDHVTRMSWTAASTLSARIRNLNSDQEPHMLVDVGMTWLGLNIVHSISISIQINQVKYIYLSSPKDIHGYPIHSMKVFYFKKNGGWDSYGTWLAGWWLTYPSKNDGVCQLGLWNSQLKGKINMFQTTNQ